MILYLAVAAVASAGAVLAVAWMRRQLRVVTIHGDSMRPTFVPGNRVLVRRVPLSRVNTGDVIVLGDPALGGLGAAAPDGRPWLIKRAIAVPGDPVPASVAPVLSVAAGSPVRDGALIALGDNPDASVDSRQFGYVLADHLLGVVLRPMTAGK